MVLSCKYDRSHWKVKIVFANFQNITTDNFNLAKTLRNPCKGVYFFNKRMNSFKAVFKNITHYISEVLPSFDNTCFKKQLLLSLSVQVAGWILSNFVFSNLIKVWLNTNKLINNLLTLELLTKINKA